LAPAAIKLQRDCPLRRGIAPKEDPLQPAQIVRRQRIYLHPLKLSRWHHRRRASTDDRPAIPQSDVHNSLSPQNPVHRLPIAGKMSEPQDSACFLFKPDR
jgi:hypothetical protein